MAQHIFPKMRVTERKGHIGRLPWNPKSKDFQFVKRVQHQLKNSGVVPGRQKFLLAKRVKQRRAEEVNARRGADPCRLPPNFRGIIPVFKRTLGS